MARRITNNANDQVSKTLREGRSDDLEFRKDPDPDSQMDDFFGGLTGIEKLDELMSHVTYHDIEFLENKNRTSKEDLERKSNIRTHLAECSDCEHLRDAVSVDEVQLEQLVEKAMNEAIVGA